MKASPPVRLTRRAHEQLARVPGDPRLIEAMLFFGNACNRACGFCCVEGSPDGGFIPMSDASIERVLALIRPDARIKLYGGEPTLHHRHIKRVVRRLRAGGYTGRLTIFSNGIQAARLIAMLEADAPADGARGSDAYLNHAIWHGQGVAPIPASRRRQLLEWAAGNPGRLYLGHDDVLPVGAAARPGWSRADEPAFGGRCARCHPTIRSDGRIHACAFAAEVDSPLYDLGSLDDDADAVDARHRRFLGWIDDDLEPRAAAMGASPCMLCLQHAGRAPLVRIEACR